MLEFWGMPSLPDPLCPGVVAPNRFLSMGQIELNRTYAKLNCLKKNYFDIQTVYLC